MISQKVWNEIFEGHHIYDCAVRKKNLFSFILFQKQDDGDRSEPYKRLVTILHDNQGKFAYGEYDGFAGPKLIIAFAPEERAIMVGRDGAVAGLGGHFDDLEDSITIDVPNAALATSVHSLATIDGYAYAAGPWRSVCRRLKSGRWESLADRASLPEPSPDKHGSTDDGFDVIDGFNAHDIYCGGGKGDLWHFDGKRWNHCPVPTNMLIESICCAGDGYVYVGLESGSVMRGRGNKWKVICVGAMSLPFQDMVWFDGKVWCTSDYGTWTIEDGKLVEPELPAQVRNCSGNLSVGDGVMLLAGMYGACAYDGRNWTTIVPASM